MNIDLHIADYRIRMTETLDYPCLSWPLYPFGSFLDHSDGYPDFDGHPDMEIAVTVVDKLRISRMAHPTSMPATASGVSMKPPRDGSSNPWIPEPTAHAALG